MENNNNSSENFNGKNGKREREKNTGQNKWQGMR